MIESHPPASQMRKNTLRALHRAGQPIFNAWLSIPSAYAAAVVAH